MRNKKILYYQGRDSWSRPVYKEANGKLWKDLDDRDIENRRFASTLNNAFDGELDVPMHDGFELEFVPKRVSGRENVEIVGNISVEKNGLDNDKKRLFVDMDGTLAEWRCLELFVDNFEDSQNVQRLINEKLSAPDYFYNLLPHENVVEAVKEIVKFHPEIDVYILSAVISEDARDQKNRWMEKYLPEIGSENRIFTKSGTSKRDYIEGNMDLGDFLFDDHSPNLTDWCPPGSGIKLLNGINRKNPGESRWKSNAVSILKDAKTLSESILNCMNGAEVIDKRPQDERTMNRRRSGI